MFPRPPVQFSLLGFVLLLLVLFHFCSPWHELPSCWYVREKFDSCVQLVWPIVKLISGDKIIPIFGLWWVILVIQFNFISDTLASNILLIFPLVIFQSVSFPEAFLEKNCYDVNLKALIRVTAHWQVDTFYAGQFYLIKHWCLLIYFSEVLYDLLLRLEGKANLSSSSFSFSVSIWQLFEIKHVLYWLPFPY